MIVVMIMIAVAKAAALADLFEMMTTILCLSAVLSVFEFGFFQAFFRLMNMLATLFLAIVAVGTRRCCHSSQQRHTQQCAQHPFSKHFSV